MSLQNIHYFLSQVSTLNMSLTLSGLVLSSFHGIYRLFYKAYYSYLGLCLFFKSISLISVRNTFLGLNYVFHIIRPCPIIISWPYGLKKHSKYSIITFINCNAVTQHNTCSWNSNASICVPKKVGYLVRKITLPVRKSAPSFVLTCIIRRSEMVLQIGPSLASNSSPTSLVIRHRRLARHGGDNYSSSAVAGIVNKSHLATRRLLISTPDVEGTTIEASPTMTSTSGVVLFLRCYTHVTSCARWSTLPLPKGCSNGLLVVACGPLEIWIYSI